MTSINFVEHPRRWTFGLASLVTVVLLSTANSAMADLEEVGFQVKISEKEMILEHPDDAIPDVRLAGDVLRRSVDRGAHGSAGAVRGPRRRTRLARHAVGRPTAS